MPEVTVAVLTNAGGAHLDAYFAGLAATKEVEAVVVGDPSGACANSAQKLLGDKLRRLERNHAKALAGLSPALALVTTEAIQAPPIIRLALDANCHVLAEKPSCVRLQDFDEVTRLADMKHRHLMLALANRLLGAVQHARKLLHDGAIGKVYGSELHIVADQTRLKSPDYHRSWFADRERSGGGHLIWLGIHWIDLVMYVVGMDIVEAAGFTANVGGQPLKVEDSAAMAVRFENGALGTITSGYYLDRGYHSHIKIWGSDGWMQLDTHGGEPLVWYGAKDSSSGVRRYDGPRDDSSYTPLVRAAVRASLDLEPPPISGADSLRVLRTVFACYRAAETGRTQRVS
jgi:predicted dehydrogenase